MFFSLTRLKILSASLANDKWKVTITQRTFDKCLGKVILICKNIKEIGPKLNLNGNFGFAEFSYENKYHLILCSNRKDDLEFLHFARGPYISISTQTAKSGACIENIFLSLAEKRNFKVSKDF